MRNLNILFFSFVLLILGACRSSKLGTGPVNEKLPGSFIAGGDSTAASPAPWRDVFYDPDLRALIDTALLRNYDLRAALQKVQIARSGLRFAKGLRLPELGVAANAGQRKFGHYTMDGIGNYDTQFSPNLNSKEQIPDPLPDYFVGFQASWEIDLWGRLKNKKKAAASRFIASQYGKDLVVTALISEVTTAYFEMIALNKEVVILEDNIALQQSAFELVEAQKQAGKANELALELVQAQLLNSKAALAEVKQQLLESESRLNFLCGAYPSTLFRDTTARQDVSAGIRAGLPSGLLQNRPDIRQAEMELRASNADVASARAAFYPSFNISAALGLQAFNAQLLLETPASVAYNVLGGLSAPLLNRRRLKAELMQTRAEQKQALIQYEKTVVNSFREVYNALNDIRTTREMMDWKTEEVALLKKSVSTSTGLFLAGRATYLEVITAQKNALQSQLELTRYTRRQNVALVNLYRSLGGGWKN